MEDPLVLLVVAGAALLGFTVAGVAGIGGGIITLPALIWAIGARDAITALAFTQILAAAGRMYFNWRDISWPVVRWFCLGAIPAVVAGSLVFIATPSEILPRLLGGNHIAGRVVPPHAMGEAQGHEVALVRSRGIGYRLPSRNGGSCGSVTRTLLLGTWVGDRRFHRDIILQCHSHTSAPARGLRSRRSIDLADSDHRGGHWADRFRWSLSRKSHTEAGIGGGLPHHRRGRSNRNGSAAYRQGLGCAGGTARRPRLGRRRTTVTIHCAGVAGYATRNIIERMGPF